MRIKIHKQRQVAKLSLRLVKFCVTHQPVIVVKRGPGRPKSKAENYLFSLSKPQTQKARRVANALKARLEQAPTTRQVMANHLASILGE